MAGIQTGIELQDNFTSVIMGVINSVNLAVSVMDSLDQSMSSGINTAAIQGARDEINDAAAAVSQLSREFIGLAGAPAIRPAQPAEWKSDALTPVVDVSGLERYQQEIQRAGQMLDSLTSTQSRISQAAASMDMLPEAAVQDIESLGTRLDAIKGKIQEIENNPVTMGTDAASAELEQLYAQLGRVHQEQERLNDAAGSMDISDINNAYLRLSQTISSTERYLRDSAAHLSPVVQPAEWKSDTLAPVVDVSGLERYQQEIQRTGQMLDSLTSTQSRISQAAVSMDILPETAVQDIALLGTRLDAIKGKIQEIENNPVTMGTDAANRQLEQLYAQLYRATQEQENLGRAMDSMDISGINSAYMRLSQTISGTERYLRDNEDAQDSFNQSVERCRAPAEHVRGSFSGWEKAIIVANNAIGLIENTLGRLGVFDISGAFGRIDTMDRFQKTVTTMTGDAGMAEAALAQLKDTTVGTAYGLDVAGAAAQGFLTRGMSLGAATDQVRIWADAVSFYGKGTNEQLESVVDAIGKMYSKGSVEADQLDRLFDAGIGAAEIYAEAVGESVAKVKDDLSNKNISSAEFIGTVSQAMDNGISSGAAKEAGDTWAATFSNVQSAVTRGWTDIIQSLDNELAAHGLPSSMEMVQSFGQTVEGVLGSVADNIGTVVAWGTRIADTLSEAGTFIADNWGTISPVVYGVAAALTVFAIAMGTVKVVTALAAAAQFLFGAALAASPLTWIIIIIGILIGIVVALANHFSGAGHVAQSAFGAICGAANVARAFLLNTVIGLVNAILQAVWTGAEPFIGIIEWILNVANGGFDSFGGAVANLIGQVISWFLSLGKIVTRIIDAIFGTDWTSGLSALQNTVLSWGKNDNAITIDRNAPSIDYRVDYGDAYADGAAWGDGVTEKVKDFFNPGNLYKDDDTGKEDYDPHGLAQDTSLIAGNTNDISKNTAKAANRLEITGEELKYLRNMAERDYINKFTTAEIKVNMTNHNKIDKELDIDGLSSKFCKKIEEELASSAEGVH